MQPTGCSPKNEDDGFLRSVTFPEEERRRLTAAHWSGGFRWFRSANIIDLEAYRRRVKLMEPPPDAG
jgi:hypothetical protein